MSTGKHAFKHNDAARLIRAATAAGLKVRSVKLVGNAVEVLVGDKDESADPKAGASQQGEWDNIK